MSTIRKVKLFRNGRNQAVRIPRDLELPGEDALLRQENGCLVLEPSGDSSHIALLERLRKLGPLPIEDRIGDITDPPPDPVDL
jgi:antitoxin VapB